MNKAEKLNQQLTVHAKCSRFIWASCLVSVKLTGCEFYGVAWSICFLSIQWDQIIIAMRVS